MQAQFQNHGLDELLTQVAGEYLGELGGSAQHLERFLGRGALGGDRGPGPVLSARARGRFCCCRYNSPLAELPSNRQHPPHELASPEGLC